MVNKLDLVIVHEQLSEYGGVERVLEALALEFPTAPIFGVAFNRSIHPRIERLPNPIFAHETDLARNQYDLALWSRETSRWVLPAARVVLTFTQCSWSLAADVSKADRSIGYLSGLSRPYFVDEERYLDALSPDDRAAAQRELPDTRLQYLSLLNRVDEIWTISKWSQSNIETVGGVSARVVSPFHGLPIGSTAEVAEGSSSARAASVVAVGRLVRHKRFDVVVEAIRQTERTAIIVGDGPELESLRSIAPRNVRLVGALSDCELRQVLSAAEVLVCPTEEEFGLVMLEALECGTPVIAPRGGAAIELIEHGRTGLLVDSPLQARGIEDALCELDDLEIDSHLCRLRAESALKDNLVRSVRTILGDR